MSNSQVIMITGATSYEGDQLSRLLLDDTSHRVIGVDQTAPQVPLHDRLDFVQADVRNRLLADLLRLEGVSTVYHLGWQSMNGGHPPLALASLLAACAAAGVAHLVWVSHTAVYGPHPTNAAFISEDQPPYTKNTGGQVADLVAGEQLCFEFAQTHPELQITVLRPAHLIGPRLASPLTRYLAGAAAPILLGFDPMMQLLDERDLLRALVYALAADPVRHDNERIPSNLYYYNLAAEGVMPLTKLLSLTHTLPLPLAHPLAYWATSLLRSTPWSVEQVVPYGWDFLRYRCVGATERQAAWGFGPRYSGLEAIKGLAAYKQEGKTAVSAPDLAVDEARLKQTLARRQQVKEAR